MATLTRASVAPNILIADGIDPRAEYRPALQSAIYDTHNTAPVRRGTHDFWLCYPYPPQNEFNPNSANFTMSDPAAASAGRALRGIGDMRRLPVSVSAADVQGRLFTALHESAHAWLVPADFKIRSSQGNLSPYLANDLTAALNAETALTRPAMIARQNAHWSCYVNFGSCMDSVEWIRSPDEGGTMRWVQTNLPLTPVQPSNLVGVSAFNPMYSDLDLMIMGAKRPDQCFPASGGQFFWLDPKLSLGDPMRYHVGLFIAFSSTDYIYFGFYNHHAQLRVERSSNGQRSATVDIGNVYHPLHRASEAMMLRVVKRGTRYIFQACHGNSAAAVLTGRGPFMFDGADNAQNLPVNGDFSTWRTVDTFDAPGVLPQAIGVTTKTWNPILAEGEFFTFETRKNGVNNALELFTVRPTSTTAHPLTSLPTNQLIADTPQAGALFRRRNFEMIMGVPYTDAYDHWAAIDHAPKIMTRAPTGNFVFGITAKVHRSFVSPGTGGGCTGMTMWGIEHSANVRDFDIPDRIRQTWVPAPATYKNAFIIVTNDRANLGDSEISKLDVFRQYYDAALSAVSHGLLNSQSRL